jgi:RHS repeat-associated protein
VLGRFQYGEDSAGPHAVTTIESTGSGTLRYRYDAAGNLISMPGQQLAYNAKQRVVEVAGDQGDKVTSVYDHRGARAKRTSINATGQEDRALYGGLYYEVRNGELVKFVVIGRERVAKIGEASGRNDELAVPTASQVAQVPSALPALALAVCMLVILLMLGAARSRESEILSVIVAWLRRRYFAAPRSFAVVSGMIVVVFLTCDRRNDAPQDLDTWPSGGMAILTDHLGSVHLLVDSNGKVVADRSHLPFGALRYQEADVRVRSGYTGKERDANTGLVSFGARYLIAGVGRWNRPDPRYLHDPSKVLEQTYRGNPYDYVLNNPLTNYDPDGRVPWAKTRSKLYNQLYGHATSTATKSAARTYLESKMPTYRRGVSECRNDAMRFLSNIGGPWRRWAPVFPDPNKGQKRVSRQLAPNTRDVFYSSTVSNPSGSHRKLWFVKIKGRTGAVQHTVRLKTGMILTIAEGQRASGSYYQKHTIVWLGGPGGEFICDLGSSIGRMSLHAPARKRGFWVGQHFKVLMIEDPYKGKP